MNIKQAKQEIKHTVEAYLQKDEHGEYRIPLLRQRPVLLMGPPGIGKTQIMEQIARECRIGLVAYTITHHTRQSAVGLPFIKEETFGDLNCSVTEYTMSEIITSVHRKMRETGLKEGILFIDEINCVSETLAPTMLQFLQYKTFGNQKVPDGWVIVAAGNPPEYNKSVRDFDMVTLDRVRRMDLEADIYAWREYARSQNLHPAILSYLEIRPRNFYRVEADVDGLQFVTARGWEDLSTLMDVYLDLGIPVTEEIIYEFLRHTDVAQDVAAYLDLYRKYQDDYGISEILKGNVKSEVYARIYEARFDERLSVVSLLNDALRQKFQQVSHKKAFLDLWYGILKEYRQLVEQNNPLECYDALVSEFQNQFELEKQGGFLTKIQKRRKENLLLKLQENRPLSAATPQEAFEQVSLEFRSEGTSLEELEAETVDNLHHTFDFMENAFEKGQEMVVFVTELTMGTESALFLADHPDERYQEYNRELLIGSRKAELLQELTK